MLPTPTLTMARSRALSSLPTDPRAAYALGLATKLLQFAPLSISTPRDGIVQQRLMAMLSDPHVTNMEKSTLIELLERATSIDGLLSALGLVSTNDALTLSNRGGQYDDSEMEDKPTTIPTSNMSTASGVSLTSIPEALGCSICCEDLMLRPASLPCGHSFCKRCLSMWLTSCKSCPTCRQPVAPTSADSKSYEIAVNRSLQEMITTLFPVQARTMEQTDQQERLQRVQELVQRALETGESIRGLVAQDPRLQIDSDHDPHHPTTTIADAEVQLHEQILAAESREQLRKARALQASSRQRHWAAYCHGVPASIVSGHHRHQSVCADEYRRSSSGTITRTRPPRRPVQTDSRTNMAVSAALDKKKSKRSSLWGKLLGFEP